MSAISRAPTWIKSGFRRRRWLIRRRPASKVPPKVRRRFKALKVKQSISRAFRNQTYLLPNCQTLLTMVADPYHLVQMQQSRTWPQRPSHETPLCNQKKTKSSLWAAIRVRKYSRARSGSRSLSWVQRPHYNLVFSVKISGLWARKASWVRGRTPATKVLLERSLFLSIKRTSFLRARVQTARALKSIRILTSVFSRSCRPHKSRRLSRIKIRRWTIIHTSVTCSKKSHPTEQRFTKMTQTIPKNKKLRYYKNLTEKVLRETLWMQG